MSTPFSLSLVSRSNEEFLSVVFVKDAWKSKHIQTFNMKESEVFVVVWNIKGSASDELIIETETHALTALVQTHNRL